MHEYFSASEGWQSYRERKCSARDAYASVRACLLATTADLYMQPGVKSRVRARVRLFTRLRAPARAYACRASGDERE